MNNNERVLVIAAHPDDEVLGMGGTIAKYVSGGATVGLLVITDGSTLQYKDDPKLNEIIGTKKNETKNSADVLGISEIFYGGMPDMKLDITAHSEVNDLIERVIVSFRPNIVFTHFEGDINRDHQCVYQSTLVACRPIPGQGVKELYSYSVPSSTEWNAQNPRTAFVPNCYIDISGGCEDKKYRAMECYKTELREYPHPRNIEALKILDRAVGLQAGMRLAESFVLHRMLK